MDNKINLETTRVLTIPLSFMNNLNDLYNLVEENWHDDDSWDDFFELLRNIVSGKCFCNYLNTEINYIDDVTKDE